MSDPTVGTGSTSGDPHRPNALWRADEGSAEDVSTPRSTTSLWRENEGATRSTAPAPAPRPVPGSSRPEKNGQRAKPAPERKDKPKRSRAGRLLRNAVWILVVAFVLDLGYAGWRTATALDNARGSLERFRTSIAGGKLDEAQAALDDADDSRGQASTGVGQPAIALLGVLPGIEKDVSIIKRLTRATGLIVEAGNEGLDAARDMGVSEEGVTGSIYQHGVVRLDRLAQATTPTQAAAQLARRAEELVESAPSPVLPPVRTALNAARRAIPRTAETTTRAAAMVKVLPQLLGADGPRDYLLAFQATGEARATGGVIGMLGVLRATGGRLDLADVRPYGDLFPDPLDEPVDAPAWFERSYGDQFATREWQQANLSPDFPTDAQVLLNLYERKTGTSLDGVIAMDPIALQDMMRGVGTLDVPGNDPVTADNAADVLLHDSYLDFATPEQQNAYLGRLVDAFWSRIRDGDLDSVAFGEGLADAVGSRHLMAYSSSEDAQSELETIGITGAYSTEDDGNVQMVFHNAYTLSKVDYFLHRRVSTDVQLSDAGTATVKTTIGMTNEAPPGPPSLLLGSGHAPGVDPGVNRMLFNVLVPNSAQIESMTIDGDDVPVVTLRDRDFPVAWHLLEIEPQSSTTVTLVYRIAKAVEVRHEVPHFRFSLESQPLVTPERFALTVHAPPGLRLAPEYTDAPAVQTYRDAGDLQGEDTFDFVIVDPG